MNKKETAFVLALVALIVAIVLFVVPVHAAPISIDAQPPAPAIDWSGLLSTIIQAAILAAISFIVPVFKMWIEAKVEEARANVEKYNPDLYSVLLQAADIAVHAAEQYKIVDKLLDKKNYAVNIAEKWLTERGFKIDVKLIEAAIESAVGLANFPHQNKSIEPELPAESKQR